MLLTPTRRRIVLTFADQSVSSVSNFATGVLVARVSGSAEFGDYMLVVMIWLVVVGLHRSLVTDPLIVTSLEAGDRRSMLSQGLRAECLIGGLVSVLVAGAGVAVHIAGAEIGTLLVALSPWFVPLVVQDFWRMMAFQERRPGLALGNDVTFLCVQAATVLVFWLLGWRTPEHIICAWGVGASGGALLGFLSHPGVGRRGDAVNLLARLWTQSRWMLADFLSTFVAGQAYLAFAALLLSRTDYGGFRAAFSLMGPTVVIMHASANIGLPEAARRAGSPTLPRLSRQLSAGTALCIATYGMVIAVAGDRLLSTLYGDQFVEFGQLATLAAVHYVIVTAVFGQYLVLKVTGHMRPLWRAQLGVSVAALVSMCVLIPRLGVDGAGWAAVFNAVCYAFAIGVIYLGRATPTGNGEVEDLARPVVGGPVHTNVPANPGGGPT